jgi:hypothetical protein
MGVLRPRPHDSAAPFDYALPLTRTETRIRFDKIFIIVTPHNPIPACAAIPVSSHAQSGSDHPRVGFSQRASSAVKTCVLFFYHIRVYPFRSDDYFRPSRMLPGQHDPICMSHHNRPA